jgi:hypothetical protein
VSRQNDHKNCVEFANLLMKSAVLVRNLSFEFGNSYTDAASQSNNNFINDD